MSNDEKARTSITLSQGALETAKVRYKELGYSSLSEMLEALILQDAAEKREHVVVRGPAGVKYTSNSTVEERKEILRKLGETTPDGDKDS